ncbi:Predicted DNA-binding protein, MmcQ/YjbR family [Reichenbachiella faecimaris]|uniref:Predicted DNA-binding protein, MmcQ/YjbR family n=1 Tax=Reichenbachiella faecimaris TaxID=692418 RepID=A0A1W2G9Z8_REIFA|nr:MmcQ/YjbR family DNA-binding protein [Reichenbachiella faecimaris]SMD33126.1 Predicted DNA-binding protein, MmcQ/YjbR family [Reichenbachiella faecimaris]
MINVETYREYCISKPGVTESCPFGPDTLVFKVMDKMFALCSINTFEFINLKCDPERAQELRAQFPAIQPGYHMNKQHWNSVYMDGTLPDELIYELIEHSYELIVESLPKKLKEEWKTLKGLD